MIYGDLHYRRDIGQQMLAAIHHHSRLNYINHLDNYNHIITDVKKMIDAHNLEVSIVNPGLSVLGRIGDFANSVQLGQYKMICSVDGAGTKTKFLEGHPRRFDILGRDIVVHNINDMFCNNGRPVALLDYFGCDQLDKKDFIQFINGALGICREYGIALIGGETAEMRGIFQAREVEVLGILLGILEGDNNPANGGDAIRAGHIVYGLESHGAHTNGFTKIREIASNVGNINNREVMPLDVREFFSQPHRCYVPAVKHLESILKQDARDARDEIRITGKAHITGGGFYDNIERILSDGLQLELSSWQLDYAWQWLFDNAGMEWREFIRVFNAGWGFCVIVNQEIPESILADMELGGYGKIKKLGKIL
jgi:phosphoribosylformylglycinamidine cyclo-ligase